MMTDLDPNSICFGFNRKTDEESLQCFIRAFASPELLEVLIPRMDNDEITSLLDKLSTLMGTHLKEREYHKLFLGRK